MKTAALAVVEVRALIKSGAHEFHQIALEGAGCGKSADGDGSSAREKGQDKHPRAARCQCLSPAGW